MEKINVTSIVFTNEELEVVRMAMVFAKDGYFQDDILDDKGKEAFNSANEKIQSYVPGCNNTIVAPDGDERCDCAELEAECIHKNDADTLIKEEDLIVLIELSENFSGYNFRRYGKPWGAVITFEGTKMVYNFSGSYLGDNNGGRVVLSAPEGTIVAFGQKDHRKPSDSYHSIYTVTADGIGKKISKSEAYDHWKDEQSKKQQNYNNK